MLVLNVLKIVCQNLGMEEYLTLTDFGGQTIATDEQRTQINQLIMCLNDVNQSIAFMYLPLKKEERITVENETLNYSSFTEPLIELISLKDDFGFKNSFSSFPNFATCKNGTYNATYTYTPDNASLISDSIETNVKVSERVMAYGVVARFYLIKGLYTEASAWDTKFQQALLVVSRKNSSTKLCGRGWI